MDEEMLEEQDKPLGEKGIEGGKGGGDRVGGEEGGLLPSLVEAILFASQKPVSAKELVGICRGAAVAYPGDSRVESLAKVKEPALEEAVGFLMREYEREGRSFEVKVSASGWQLVTKADFAPWMRQLFPENRPARLSAPAMETLAIIAYRQPLTRADIEAVRGVAVDGVMQTLLDRGLVKIAGRSELPGRALLYETTQHFMEHFALRNLDELPNARELRAVSLPKGEEKKEQPKKGKAVKELEGEGEKAVEGNAGEGEQAIEIEEDRGEEEDVATGVEPEEKGETNE